MKSQAHFASWALLLATVSVGCAPGANDEAAVPSITSEEFRAEVTAAIDDIQAELAELQERIVTDADSSFTDLASSTQMATSEMMARASRFAWSALSIKVIPAPAVH